MMGKEQYIIYPDCQTSFTPGLRYSAGPAPVSSVEDYVKAADVYRMDTIGMADTSIVTWQFLEREARRKSKHPIFGLEVNALLYAPADYHTLTLLVETDIGFNSLYKLSQLKLIKASDLRAHRDGLIVLAPTRSYTSLTGIYDKNQMYLAVRNFGDEESFDQYNEALRISYEARAQIVASNKPWQASPQSYNVLISQIRKASETGLHFSELDFPLERLKGLANNDEAYRFFKWYGEKYGLLSTFFPPHPQGYVKSPGSFAALFSDATQAIQNLKVIAKRCKPEHVPVPPLPKYQREGITDTPAFLRTVAWEGLLGRYQHITPEIVDRFEEEIRVFTDKKLVDYVLIIWDVLSHIKQKGKRAVGLGSASGSLVCYALGITDVDPIKYRLRFERFVNEYTEKNPDEDFGVNMDEHDEYFEDAAQTAKELDLETYRIGTYPQYHERSGLREIMKVFGYSDLDISEIEYKMDKHLYVSDYAWQYLEIARAMEQKHMRQSSTTLPQQDIQKKSTRVGARTHSSKIILTQNDLRQTGPFLIVDNPKRPTVPIAHVDKTMAEASFINIDLVSKYGIALIEQCESMLQHPLHIDEDDQNVYQMVFSGGNIGLPELETPWMIEVTGDIGRNTLPGYTYALQDIALAISISKPGVWRYFEEYLAYRSGRKQLQYAHGIVKDVLGETFGMIVYQEQVLELAEKLGGFPMDEREKLRKAISKERSPYVMQQFKDRFIKGAAARGVTTYEAADLFERLSRFSEYGLLSGHALAMVIGYVYESAFFKYHYPDIFFKATKMLGNGHYFVHNQVNVYKREAARFGVNWDSLETK